jgi:hypothetical protein
MPIAFDLMVIVSRTTVFRRGSAGDWGTVLQAERSRVRFPMVSLEFFWPRYGPGVGSHSNRNECQEYFQGGKGGRWLGLTILPPSCADCHEIWDTQPTGTLRACPGLLTDCLTVLSLEAFMFGDRSITSRHIILILTVPCVVYGVAFSSLEYFLT